MAEKKGQVGVIKEYFNMTTGDMRVEYKELSNDERLERAKGAAKAMGLKAEEVSFPLD